MNNLVDNLNLYVNRQPQIKPKNLPFIIAGIALVILGIALAVFAHVAFALQSHLLFAFTATVISPSAIISGIKLIAFR
jgi:hypothetical protein